jgi:signal transduction histidine kinase
MARILLVEDDDNARLAVREAIRRLSPHDVVEACNGRSAVERVAREELDLVLLDPQLPDLDGFEVCRKIRAEDRTSRLPIVFLTPAQDQVENRLRGLEIGVADVIVQPVNDRELMARIGSVLRSKALAEEVRRHTSELQEKVDQHTRQLEELAHQLRVERDALRETFDVIEDGLYLFDGAGRIQLENAAGRRLRQVLASTSLPSPAVQSGPGRGGDGDEPSGEGALDSMLAALAREAVEQDGPRAASLARDGRQFEARAWPAAGRRALVYVRDVTEARDIEVRRLQSEKLASIGMLAAGVAHEINNPASFVLANVEALAGLLRLIITGILEGAPSPPAGGTSPLHSGSAAGGPEGGPSPPASYATMEDRLRSDATNVQKLGLKDLLFEAMAIVQESKEGMARIHRIVRDLHGFSRVEDDPAGVTDVNAAVESALTMLRNELRYRAQVHRDLRACRLVRGSSARIGQVFLNLVLNAAHALKEGELKKNRIVVRSYEDGEHVVVEVEDNGKGISPIVMPRIFDSFFTTKPAGLGTGLGLSISREIVRAAGGEITAESEGGQGALFRVRLPAVLGPVFDDKTPTPNPIRRRYRLLAVDDEVLLLKAYRRMLIDHHDVELALGGAEALRILGEDRAFDVVLCDLQMPEMSGADVFSAVAERWPGFEQRFIIITGGAFSPEGRRFLDEGQITCLNKPFQLEEILDLVERRVAAVARRQ